MASRDLCTGSPDPWGPGGVSTFPPHGGTSVRRGPCSGAEAWSLCACSAPQEPASPSGTSERKGQKQVQVGPEAWPPRALGFPPRGPGPSTQPKAGHGPSAQGAPPCCPVVCEPCSQQGAGNRCWGGGLCMKRSACLGRRRRGQTGWPGPESTGAGVRTAPRGKGRPVGSALEAFLRCCLRVGSSGAAQGSQAATAGLGGGVGGSQGVARVDPAA